VHEVGGAFGAEHARGAGRPRSVETGDDHLGVGQADLFDGSFQTVYDLLEAHFGSLLGSGGILAQPFD
jgi:hypothetical protein